MRHLLNFFDHCVTMFKVHLSKPIRTLLTQNSKNIGKIPLPRSMFNSYIQLLSGKPGSLKNTSTNLSARVLIPFASLYVDLSPSYYYRIQVNDTMVQLGYWIVEPLVNRATEFYPRGGMSQLVSFPSSDNRQITDNSPLSATRSEPVESVRDCSHSRPPCSSWCSGSTADVCWKVKSILVNY